MQAFADSYFLDLLALDLLSQLPVAGFWQSQWAKGKIKVRGVYKPNRQLSGAKMIKSPAEFWLVGIKPRSSTLPQPQILATLSPRRLKIRNTKKANIQSLFTLQWKDPRPDESAKALFDGSALVIGDDLDQFKDEVKKHLQAYTGTNQQQKQIAKGATDAGGTYLGLRYGRQVFDGIPLLKDAEFYGLIGEIDKGILSGLRVYYDVQSQKTLELDMIKTFVGWSRFIVGWAYPLYWFKSLDRIEIVSRVGYWSYSSRLPATYKEDGTVASASNFSISRKFSLGIEAALEKTWSSLLNSRLWYGRDVALSLFGILGTQSVTSDRYGTDLWWRFQDQNLSLLEVPNSPFSFLVTTSR